MSLPTLPVSFEELFQIEQNLESGFVAAMTSEGLGHVASSRSGITFESPFVSLWVQNGATVDGMQKAIPGLSGNLYPYAAFEGVLTTEIVTNRVNDLESPQHLVIVGKVRKALQAFRLVPVWNKFQNISLVYDIREGGTIDTWEDGENLDHTAIIWNIRHALNPAAWPADINA